MDLYGAYYAKKYDSIKVYRMGRMTTILSYNFSFRHYLLSRYYHKELAND